ncbi:MAG: DUF6249 domain-containing protein [Henriciella sp.]|nr:DUF6249 domain-containing protein [Henriciella sp.]
MEDTLIPITFFFAIVGIIWLFSHYNFKKRDVAHQTLRHAVDKGQEVSPELIERMSYLSDPIKSDLRRGVLFVAFGLAVISLGLFIPTDEPEAFQGILGVSSFPIILGLAYLGLWRFGHER